MHIVSKKIVHLSHAQMVGVLSDGMGVLLENHTFNRTEIPYSSVLYLVWYFKPCEL